MGHEEADVDVSRRDLGSVLAALGGAAGLAALAGCAEKAVAAPEQVQAVTEAISGGAFLWVDSIVGGSGSPKNLRSLFGSDGNNASRPVVAVGGYSVSGDGGGGLFYWSAASFTDDGGTFIVPGADGGTGPGSTGPGWKRLYSGALDIRWFGANATATDNTPAIQAALAAAQRVNSSTVYVPAGAFNVNQGNFAVSGATGLVIRGDGYGKSIIKDTRADSRNASLQTVSGIGVYGLFSFINCSDCGVADIQLVGNCTNLNGLQSTNVNYKGIFTYSVPNFFVRQCLVTAFVDEAILGQGEGPNWNISHNILKDTNLSGVNPQLNSADDSVIIAHNFFSQCCFGAIQANGGAVVIHGNTMTFGLGRQIGRNVLLVINAIRAVITDNVIYDSDTSNDAAPTVYVAGATSAGSETIIANNIITGIVADWTDALGSAICVDTGTSNGATGPRGGTITIANNVIDNCGRNDSTQARAIVLAGQYIGSAKVYGNTIRNRLPNNVRIGIRVQQFAPAGDGLPPPGSVTIGRNFFDFDPSDSVASLPYCLDSAQNLDQRISESKRVVSSPGATALAISDEDVFVTANGAVTLTLPDATLSYGGGKRLMLKNTVAQGGTTAVNTVSSQTIDGSPAQSMAGPGASLTVESDGSNWQVIAKV